MDKVTTGIAAILCIAMVIFISPGILRANRGKMLRNIALWIAIFLGLALAYRHVGPGRDLVQQAVESALPAAPGEPNDNRPEPQPPADVSDDQGFMPPRE